MEPSGTTAAGVGEPKDRGVLFSARKLLGWIYVGRMALATGLLLPALAAWGEVPTEGTWLAAAAFSLALAVTAGSFWHTHVQDRDPGHVFRYGQVLFDVLLVTLAVDMTGGGDSPVTWLYILVITGGAFLLPLAGGILVGILVSVLFLGAVVWRHEPTLTGAVGLLMALFALVAVVTGLLGDRMRRAGMALDEVESELRRLRLDTGDILDTIATGILTVDADERLVYVNPAGEELLGLDADPWVGRPMEEGLGRISPDLVELLRESVRTGRPLARRTARVRRLGNVATLGMSTTVRGAEGEDGQAVTASFQDITLAERLAEARRRADRLQAVAAMSASMAHEIKNPLASIRSAVEQLTRPNLEEEDRDTLREMVVTESERLSRLLSDFIDFSRIRKDEVEEVDLAGLVLDAVEVVRQNPEVAEGVAVRVEGVEERVTLPADPDILHRAVTNLVLNAAQFSGPDGEVVVRVVDHRGERNPPDVGVPRPVGISVRDSGPGVPEEERSHIFDPFYTTRKGGSGLGLAVVHRAVEVHDGAVFVENRQEGGAEFTLYLPGRGVGDASAPELAPSETPEARYAP